MENFFGHLVRNPADKNSGKFVTLAEFLELTKTKAVSGILINMENAAYLASQKGLDIVASVTTALSNANFDKQSTQKVFIQSDDNSALLKFNGIPGYRRVFHLTNSISGAAHQIAEKVKDYADAVYVHRDAIVVASDDFAYNITKTIPALHAANVSVFVGVLKNEFENLIFDYLSDPYVEIATFQSLEIDGYVTNYPATANLFVWSSCSNQDSKYVIQPMQPGFLFEADPVAEPPLLSQADVVDPPLSAMAKNATADSETPTSSEASTSTPVPPPKSSGTSAIISMEGLLLAATAVVLLTIHV